MGFSADAHLVFGVVIESHDEDYVRNPFLEALSEHDNELDNYVAKQRGIVSPWDQVPDFEHLPYHEQSKTFEEWKNANPQWEQIKEDWYAALKAIRDELRVELRGYGSYDSYEERPYILTLKSAEDYWADAWSPKPIDPENLRIFVTEKQISKAAEQCSDLNLPAFEDPKWYLVASYG